MKNYITTLLFVLVCFTSFAQKHKRLGYHFDKKTFNFGDVEQWNNQPATFTFTNNTKKSVTFLPIFSENDLDIVIPEKVIAVGESVIIKAMYYTAGKGPFSREFKVYLGSYPKPIYLKIVGNIKSLSPEAYIQCPMSKPELAKSKIEIVGDVADIETETPINEATIILSSLNAKKEYTLLSTGRGKFGTKLDVGNYFVTIKHPDYVTYNGSVYIGQTSPPLRIRLTPLKDEPIFTQTEKTNEPENHRKFKEEIKEDIEKNIEEKPKFIEKKQEESDDVLKDKPLKKEAKKNEGLDRNIDYVKHEPKDNLYTKNKANEEVPNTLTTYKESELPEKVIENVPKHKEPINKDDYFGNDMVEEKVNKKEAPSKTKEPITPKKQKIDKEEDEKNVEKPLKQNEEESEIVKKKDKIKEIEPKNVYTFRVFNKKTLEPIANANIQISELYKKRIKKTDKTDEKGYSELALEKNDYLLLASAKGFITDEIRILKEDNSEVFRVELTPVSDLYDDIYNAKKNEKDDKETLEQFSFGKTDFTFANETDEEVLRKKRIEDKRKADALNAEIAKVKLENEERENLEKIKREKEIEFEKAQEIKKADLELKNALREKELERLAFLEKEKLKKEKEDALNDEIAKAKLENEKLERLNKIKREKEIALEKEKEGRKLDSLNLFIKELLAKNNELESDLDKTNAENNDLENENNRNQETIETLNSKNNELLQPKDEAVLSKTKYVANNILFLIDVSTSMGKMKKMDMLKTSIKNLSLVLRDIDRVAIIAYNQKSQVVLESVNGDNTETIIAAIDSLKTGGLTNGVRGIKAAYEMLEYYYIPDGNNQIILATDGLFSKYNNEMTAFELNVLVKMKALKNMNLTVVGFGKDESGKKLMTNLANNGGGQYIQIQNEWMTKDVLIKEIQLNSKKVD